MTDKKQLTTLLIGAIVMSLGVGMGVSKWYWSTQSFMYSVTVDGSIGAKSNFTPSTVLASAPMYEDIETVDTLLTVNGGESRYIWIILSPESIVNEVYLRVMVECPEGSSATALVSTQEYSVSAGSIAPVELGTVPVDGTESIQIIRGGDPLWVTKSVWGTSYRFIRIQIDFDTSGLTVGSHDFICRVEVGDAI